MFFYPKYNERLYELYCHTDYNAYIQLSVRLYIKKIIFKRTEFSFLKKPAVFQPEFNKMVKKLRLRFSFLLNSIMLFLLRFLWMSQDLLLYNNRKS